MKGQPTGCGKSSLGRLLADHDCNLVDLGGVDVTSPAAQVNTYRLGSDYALYRGDWRGPRHGKGLGFESPRAYHKNVAV
jgi:hypothetical protein